MRSSLHQLRSSIALSVIMLCPAASAAGIYDANAAATRSEYSVRVARCKKLSGSARPNCMKAAKAQARSALAHTYEGAVAAAKASYANATAKCAPMNRVEHRRCLKAARAERAMALGRAEEIRSAPLAMGMN